ncbi:MAG: 4-alpha-glucanotransferase [Bacteroidales bacterium]|nr:4-alpha-glucanotransferase [Bacteroidales bacterium]
MKIQLSIDYRTNWGEAVCAEFLIKKSKGNNVRRELMLETEDGVLWTGEMNITDKDAISLSYYYNIKKGDIVVRQGWMGMPRSFRFDNSKKLKVRDFWRDLPVRAHMYSNAYCHLHNLKIEHSSELTYFDKTLILRVNAPQLLEGQVLAIVGDLPLMGAWDASHALRLQATGLHEWSISLSASSLVTPFEYKYVVLDEKTGDLKYWEEGANRKCNHVSVAENEVVVLYDDELHVDARHWKVAGVVVPVFSLRSEGSQGVGDFGDLKMMVDWAAKTQMHMIQLLPIYDTTQTRTWQDSYPYNSISIYALHPVYMDIRQLNDVKDKDFMHEYELRREQLNGEFTVDYELAVRLKRTYIHRIYEQEGTEVFASEDYKKFFDDNAKWLIPYAAFSYLRDKYETSDFNRWPEFATYDEAAISRFCSPARKHYKDVAYYYYLQYQLYKQLSEVTRYARANGVVLKGDIPIGISRNSVEAWVEPHLFHMNGQAGAPPDAFCKEGQNWGFPTYNWEKMAEDGYSWWKERLSKMSQFFDAYRIDHVLGFFRIWEVPLHSVQGLLGQFSPSMPMTRDEIRMYGLSFHDEYLVPLITEGILYDTFGPELMQRVKEQFLNVSGRDRYQLKPEFDTQLKIKEFFAGAEDEESEKIRNGLYSLTNHVLFVRDKDNPEMFHPRIEAMSDPAFTALDGSEQSAFSRLHNDYYYNRHNNFWYEEAKKKLPALVESTGMLCCAEDLGMVPACVRPLMEELRMLSLEIQTMPKEYGVTFGRLENNPYRSVATIFTHDMATLRMWWEEDQQRTQQYYHDILQKDGMAPDSIPGWLCEEVVARHLFSPSMLCLISLQNWLSIDDTMRYPDPSEERINVPANSRHYWRYRMPLYIEQLLNADSFNDKIARMIEHAGRA